MARVYESNGPDVKIRGNPSHIAEKYVQLARDAQSSGDPVAAENYYQHAEHYFRLIAAAQDQFRQSNPQAAYRPDNDIGRSDTRDARRRFRGRRRRRQQPRMGTGDEPFGTREPQPYMPRDAQPYPHTSSLAATPAAASAASAAGRDAAEGAGDVDRLPSFITGGQPRHSTIRAAGQGQNGHDNQPDRFPLHRRRRRHRGGPRHDTRGRLAPRRRAAMRPDESLRRGD